MLSDERKDKFVKDLSTPVEGEDAMHRVERLMEEMRQEALRKMALEFRINYVSNLAGSIRQKLGDISTEELDKVIDWEKVNKILFDNPIENDYNLGESVASIAELSTLHSNVVAASLGLGAWIKKTCRDCGTVFYIDRGELDFFEKKSLSIPTRCKKCREARKNKNGGKTK